MEKQNSVSRSLLVVTLGTSDIQMEATSLGRENLQSDGGGKWLWKPDVETTIALKPNRGNSDMLLLDSPRIDGQTLFRCADAMMDSIRFPLIEPLIDWIVQRGIDISHVLVVTTDQKDAEERFTRNDTLHCGRILCRWLSSRLSLVDGAVKDFAIERDATDVDSLYIDFQKMGRSFPVNVDDFDSAYLLAQGGIDQINQALTLQLIHLFRNRLTQFQILETGQLKMLVFPALFIKDLERENIVKHVNDYDFEKINADICSDKWVVEACLHLTERLSLRHSGQTYSRINESYHAFRKEMKREPLFGKSDVFWKGMAQYHRNEVKLRDLYLALKIRYRQGDFNDFVWRIFTFIENMFKCEVDTHVQLDTKEYFDDRLKQGDRNEPFIAFLEQFRRGLPLEFKDKRIALHNPTRRAYKRIYGLLVSEGRLKPRIDFDVINRIHDAVNRLAELRNDVAHSMGNASVKLINEKVKSQFRNMDEMFETMDLYLGIDDGFGDIQPIRKEILAYYRVS